jgi:hypothetical protein
MQARQVIYHRATLLAPPQQKKHIYLSRVKLLFQTHFCKKNKVKKEKLILDSIYNTNYHCIHREPKHTELDDILDL